MREGIQCYRKRIHTCPFLLAEPAWLLALGINHLSGIASPTPDTGTLTAFASLLMSDGMMVRPFPSYILIILSSRGDTHLLSGTWPQTRQPQCDSLWWLPRRFQRQIDGVRIYQVSAPGRLPWHMSSRLIQKHSGPMRQAALASSA